MSTQKILMLVGDYVEDYEVMVPFQALLMVGHTVHAVCPGKKAGDMVRTAIHDFEGDQTYSEKPGHNFTLNATFAEVREDELRRPGHPRRPRPGYLRLNEQVLDIVRHFAREEADRRHLPRSADPDGGGRAQWAAVHGLSGVRAGGEAAGARWTEVPIDQAHVDGNLVTAPAWPAHPAWLAKFLVVMAAGIGAGKPQAAGVH